MPESKRRVVPVEISYTCDKCNHGTMRAMDGAESNADGIRPHQCVICSHQHSFKWVTYPYIAYIGEDELV
jgi:hypothetical protein